MDHHMEFFRNANLNGWLCKKPAFRKFVVCVVFMRGFKKSF